MIELKIEDYCNNCSEFRVRQNTLYYTTQNGGEEAWITLKCENSKLCVKLYNKFHNDHKDEIKED